MEDATLIELAQHIALVKDQLEFHQRQATKHAREPHRARVHLGTAEGFRTLLADLLRLQDFQSAHPNWMTLPNATRVKRLALSWEEIEGLPSEVLEELSISDSDRVEFNIAAGVRAMGGVATLDRIIIYLWREFGEVHKRTPLNQRLYRMTQKEMLFSVPGKKGVYSSEPLSEEDAANLT
jgi:hypothetical protein